MQWTTQEIARRPVLAASVALVLAGSAAAIVQAQGVGPVFGQPRPDMLERMCEDREARALGQLAYIHKKVGMKPEQEADWEEFSKKTLAAVTTFNPCKEGLLPLEDPIAMRDRMEQTIEQAYVFFTSMRNAADALDAGLDDEQKLRFAVAILPPPLARLPRP